MFKYVKIAYFTFVNHKIKIKKPAYALKNIINPTNSNIPIQLKEKEIYNIMLKEGTLPEQKLNILISNSADFWEAEFKDKTLQLISQSKNFLNKSIVELCRLTYKNPYFIDKFPEFWELLCDEIDLRIESSFTNEQIIDVTRYISKVNFSTKPDFFKLMEDTIIDSPIPFSPQENYQIISAILTNDEQLGSAAFFKLTINRIIKHKELFSLYDIVKLTVMINNHRYVIDNNFGLNKAIEEQIQIRKNDLRLEEILKITGLVFKNNILENKVKFILEDLALERLSLKNANIETNQMVRLLENTYKFNYFRNSKLYKTQYLLISNIIKSYKEKLLFFEGYIQDKINTSEIYYISNSQNILKQLLIIDEDNNRNDKKNNRLRECLISTIKFNELIDKLPHIINLFLTNQTGINTIEEITKLETDEYTQLKEIIELFLVNCHKYNQREKVFFISKVIKVSKYINSNTSFEIIDSNLKSNIIEIVKSLDIKTLTPHESKLLYIALEDDSNILKQIENDSMQLDNKI